MFTEIRFGDNVCPENNILSAAYDSVVLLLYPEECNVKIPQPLVGFIRECKDLDRHVTKEVTVWRCDFVNGNRLVISPIKELTLYTDSRVVLKAARKGLQRAVQAGSKYPLLVTQPVACFSECQLVTILGAFDAIYVPLHKRQTNPDQVKRISKLGIYAENSDSTFERIIRNAIALETSRIVCKDIAGTDPERMTPQLVVEFVNNLFHGDSVKIRVVDDVDSIRSEYPLLAAVNRANSTVERHQARVVHLEYTPSNLDRVTDTLLLVGKGITFDTGGADIKIMGGMRGMSMDKSGAAAVAAFVKACSILKPPHLKVVGVLCLAKNSIGSDAYVPDEILVSKSGKTIRVGNTDAEGRLAMADALCHVSRRAAREKNPHIYTIATLTGHAYRSYGPYTVAIDNHYAAATKHASRLEASGGKMADPIEVSALRPEDFDMNVGRNCDLHQFDSAQTKGVRQHQSAAAFLMMAGDLLGKSVKYTHLDIAGSCGILSDDTANGAPVLALCHAHKVFE